MSRTVSVRWLGLAAALSVISLAGEARADWAMVAVLGDAAVAAEVRGRAGVEMRRAGYDILSDEAASAVGPSLTELERCVSAGASCMKAALVAAEVDRLLLIEVRRSQRDLVLVARLYDGTTGKLLRSEARECKACAGSTAAMRTVDEVVAATMDVRPQAEAREAWIDVQTEPPGAAVYIDGQSVGPSGRSYRVSPGARTIRVELAEHDSAEARVDAREGETEAVRLSLLARVQVPAGPRRFGAWRWAAMGGGVALAAAGVAGIVVDGPRFDDMGGRLPERWSTLGPGVGATLAGAALLGLSGYMFYSDARLSGETSEAPLPGVVIEPLPGGMGLGLAGIF